MIDYDNLLKSMPIRDSEPKSHSKLRLAIYGLCMLDNSVHVDSVRRITRLNEAIQDVKDYIEIRKEEDGPLVSGEQKDSFLKSFMGMSWPLQTIRALLSDRDPNDVLIQMNAMKTLMEDHAKMIKKQEKRDD